jgi:hypothetical protein
MNKIVVVASEKRKSWPKPNATVLNARWTALGNGCAMTTKKIAADTANSIPSTGDTGIERKELEQCN